MVGIKPNLISILGRQGTQVLFHALLPRLLTSDEELFSLPCLSFPVYKTATTSHCQHLIAE